MNKIFAILLLLSSVISLSAQTGDTIRICTWNLRGYDTGETQERKESIKKVLNEIDADILVIQGTSFKRRGSVNFFKDIVENLNYSIPYSEIPDIGYKDPTTPALIEEESRIFYRNSKLLFLETLVRGCDYFNYNYYSRFVLQSGAAPDTINMYAVMYNPQSETDRATCATQVYVESNGATGRVFGNPNNVMILAGSMYFSRSGEGGYKSLTFRLVDPASTVWRADSTEFLNIYTNSTRGDLDSGCGGTTGIVGLSQRYDFLMHLRKYSDIYIPNSYTVFGNDGLDRRNSSITDPPNQKVSLEIAEALQCASSHLPVYADYVFGKVTSIEETSAQTFHLSATPNPASTQSLITFTLLKESAVKLSVFDAAGREVLKLFSGIGSFGENHFLWNTENLPQGVYFIRLEADGKSAQAQCAILR